MMKRYPVHLIIFLTAISICVSCSGDIDPTAPVVTDNVLERGGVDLDQTASVSGLHRVIVRYTSARISDDHDSDGPGEWYFGLTVDGEEAPGSFDREYEADDGDGTFEPTVNFRDIQHTVLSTIPRFVPIEMIAKEQDPGPVWDPLATSVLSAFVPAQPGRELNEWHLFGRGAGDVTHRYQYFVENLRPSVGPITGPSTGVAGVPYTWTTTGSDPEGDDLVYLWSIPGDGQNLTHAFMDPGTYRIRVFVGDRLGGYSGFSFHTVTITTNPDAQLSKWKVSPSPHTASVGEEVILSAHATNNGSTPAYVGARFRIIDGRTITVASPTTGSVLVGSGESAGGRTDPRMTAVWVPTRPGIYRVIGESLTNPASTKEVKVSVK